MIYYTTDFFFFFLFYTVLWGQMFLLLLWRPVWSLYDLLTWLNFMFTSKCSSCTARSVVLYLLAYLESHIIHNIAHHLVNLECTIFAHFILPQYKKQRTKKIRKLLYHEILMWCILALVYLYSAMGYAICDLSAQNKSELSYINY